MQTIGEGTPDFYQQFSERQRISTCKESTGPFHRESNAFMESNYTFRPNSRHHNNLQTQHSQSLAFTMNSDYKSNKKKNAEEAQPLTHRNEDGTLIHLCKDLSKIHEYTSGDDASNIFLHDTQTSAQEVKQQSRQNNQVTE